MAREIKKNWQEIGGWCYFDDLYREIAEKYGSGVFVEVGAWKGQSAALMAELIKDKPISFFIVDHFQGSDEPCQQNDPDITRLREVFEGNVPEWVKIIQLPSIEGARQFKDRSLDFVFLDAAHDYESVRADIEAWKPKIKADGTLAGDDYSFPGVAQAVTELLPDASPVGRAWRWENAVDDQASS